MNAWECHSPWKALAVVALLGMASGGTAEVYREGSGQDQARAAWREEGGRWLDGDRDGDGLADAFEARVASDYLPHLSLHPQDGCPLGGLVYRVRPHPEHAERIHLTYVHFFEKDCGLSGHIGDWEGFGVTVDPTRPPPAGILAIRAVSHRHTVCERASECATDRRGSCAGLHACQLIRGVPAVFSSQDKHASYVSEGACGDFTCFDSCAVAPRPHRPPMINAGEPGRPLVSDLTADGFVNAEHGWTESELFHLDPWSSTMTDDLTDAELVPPTCR
jgi:hypothetical protein